MLQSYIEIFKIPGSFAFSFFGLIARFSLAMNTLSIITMISAKYNHYGLASAVATFYVICGAFIAPQISRLADHFGQARIAVPATVCAVCAMIALIFAVYFNAPKWSLFACAGFMGFMPNFGAFVRTRWSRLFHGSLKLHAAFSYESTIDETVFMTGPIIVIFLATHFFPEAGLLGSACLLSGGAFLFCLQRKTEPALIPAAKHGIKRRPLILSAPIAIVTCTLMAAGSIFGTAEVGAVAIGKAQGDLAGSMWPLAAYAFGSFIAGLVYGSLKLQMELTRQFLIAITVTAVTTLPFLLAGTIESLTIVLLIAGAACSPTIITAMKLIETIAPPEKMTEGITWAMTGMGIGFAVGMALAGQMIDRFGPSTGFYIAVIAGFAAFALIFTTRRKLEAAKSAAESSRQAVL